MPAFTSCNSDSLLLLQGAARLDFAFSLRGLAQLDFLLLVVSSHVGALLLPRSLACGTILPPPDVAMLEAFLLLRACARAGASAFAFGLLNSDASYLPALRCVHPDSALPLHGLAVLEVSLFASACSQSGAAFSLHGPSCLEVGMSARGAAGCRKMAVPDICSMGLTLPARSST